MKQFTEGYNNKLKNKLFGLLCEYEKEGEWEKYLDSIIIELEDFNFDNEKVYSINYYILMNKIYSLRYIKYEYFRRTIFDCMSLLGKNDELL